MHVIQSNAAVVTNAVLCTKSCILSLTNILLHGFDNTRVT